MIPPVDIAQLPPAAQKILDPNGPAPLKNMAARGIVPGLKPGDLVTIVALLGASADPGVAETAKKTLHGLPAPVLTAALSADLEPFVVAEVGNAFLGRSDVMERLLAMPRIALETVADFAGRCSEMVAELIAVNEERLLREPRIIERLYMNRATRMSTADRIIELAVRHKLELTGIPAYKEVAIAIGQELLALPALRDQPNPDDVLFKETLEEGKRISFNPGEEDTHEVTDEGEEKVAGKFVPLYAKLANMTTAQKIRAAMLGSAPERMLLMRDGNRLVASSAIRSPMVQEPEVVRVSMSRMVSEEVLRIISMNKDWLRNHQIKVNLVTNPRTPFAMSARLIPHLREHELKALARSKNVTGPISTAAKNQLNRKNK